MKKHIEKIQNSVLSSCYHSVITLALEIGEIQKDAFRTNAFKISTKSSAVDLVTEIDQKCDEAIVNRLKTLFPLDSILSEEQGMHVCEDSQESVYEWIIDPLDGTTNYSIGHPIFAISIARWKNNVPEFGVVYVPMLDELFYAERGRGAYMNHQKIMHSEIEALNSAVLATGFPYDRATARNNNGGNLEKMIPYIKGVRRMGAAAYDLCLVAAGIYDAFWELRLGKWDMAAGILMITEAGGTFYHQVENEKYNVIAGNKTLVQLISAIVDLEN